MTTNVFSRPSDTFRTALESPSILGSVIIVFLTAILFSIIFFLATGNIVPTIIIFTGFFVNWFVLSVVFWLFSFMFSKEKRKLIKSNFIGVLTATSRLWLFFILIGIFVIIGALGGIFLQIAAIIIILLFILFLIDSFILMRVILDLNNWKILFAWLLAIFIYGLLNSMAFAITNSLFVLL